MLGVYEVPVVPGSAALTCGGFCVPRWTLYTAAPDDGAQLSVGVELLLSLFAGARRSKMPACAQLLAVVNFTQLVVVPGQPVLRARTRHSYVVPACSVGGLKLVPVAVPTGAPAVQP